ncbi:MAG: hypothetical protein MR029_07515 [Clostridium sp.]|nr:hypothetical protein [Clostridium sp.]
MKKIMKKNINWQYCIMWIIILLALVQITVYFAYFKEGFHSDEIWSYGYANSTHEKNIYENDDGTLSYMNEWTDTSVLRDYIVVNKGEQFQYNSVYNNKVLDLSPPLHSIVLHTICSFFPDSFSKWYSYLINVISFIISMIFLYKCAALLKDETFALCCSGIYGFSLAARDTYIYLRMYAMATAMTLVVLYNIIKYLQKSKEDNKIVNRNMVAACIVSYLSFLTNYHQIALVGILTMFVCIYLMFGKQIKRMFAFGLGMLGAFCMAVVSFPSMFQAANRNNSEVKGVLNYNFEIRFRVLMNFVSTKLFNIHIDIFKSGYLPIVLGCIVFGLLVLTPLFVLLRDTKQMKKLREWIFNVVKHPKQVLQCILSKINWIYVILTLTILCQIIVIGETTKVYGMGRAEDRYIFNIYPIVVLCVMGVFFCFLDFINIRKQYKIFAKVFIGIVLIGINIYNCTRCVDYFFLRGNKDNIENEIYNTECIYIRNTPFMLTTMVPILMNADEFLQVQYPDYELLGDKYQEKKNQKVTVVIDTSFVVSREKILEYYQLDGEVEDDTEGIRTQRLYDDIIKYLEDLEPETKMKKLTEQSIFGRDMEVYCINP